MSHKQPEWDVNIKDENRWVTEQERIIALRKARGIGFILKLLFVLFLMAIGLVFLFPYDVRSFVEDFGGTVPLVGAVWILLMIVMLLRVKYLKYKYQS